MTPTDLAEARAEPDETAPAPSSGDPTTSTHDAVVDRGHADRRPPGSAP